MYKRIIRITSKALEHPDSLAGAAYEDEVPDELWVEFPDGELAVYVRKPRPGSFKEASVTPATIMDMYRFAIVMLVTGAVLVLTRAIIC